MANSEQFSTRLTINGNDLRKLPVMVRFNLLITEGPVCCRAL
jgi:hypothetical protein